MNSKLTVTIGIALIAGLVSANPGAGDYASLRKQYRVAEMSKLSAMPYFVGTKVVELQGTVSGFVGTDEGMVFMVATPDGVPISISSKNGPSWMRVGSVTARMLVEINRTSKYGSWNGKLLTAIQSELLSSTATKTPPPVVVKKTVTRTTGSPTSRSGSRGRPEPMPGTLVKSGTPAVTPKAKPKATWDIPESDALPFYKAFIKKENKKLSDAEAEEIARGIIGFSLKYDVDARLIMAVVLTETNFRPKLVSRAGAMGLGQLMPVNVRELGIKDPFDNMENLNGTVKLIRGHLDKYSKKTSDPDRILTLSLAGYNAGDGAVRRHGGVPPYRETQNYVVKVKRIYRELAGLN